MVTWVRLPAARLKLSVEDLQTLLELRFQNKTSEYSSASWATKDELELAMYICDDLGAVFFMKLFSIYAIK